MSRTLWLYEQGGAIRCGGGSGSSPDPTEDTLVYWWRRLSADGRSP